jgi:O-antigen ligase
VIALFLGSTEGGRLWLPAGRFANPNDLADILLIGLPFWWWVLTDARTSRIWKPVALLLMGLMLLIMLRTGSRGAMIALLAVVVVVFLRAPARGKLILAGASALVVLCAALVLPPSVAKRYVTFFQRSQTSADLQEETEDENAVGSSEARRELLKASLELTLQHPLFGVGAGQFAVAQDEEAKAEGERRGRWQVTHNSYTELSSEIGIPGLVFYLGILASCFKALFACRFRRHPSFPEAADLARMASCLNVSLLAFAVCSFFASVAYQSFLPVLAGIAVATSAINSRLRSAPPIKNEPTGVPRQARAHQSSRSMVRTQ